MSTFLHSANEQFEPISNPSTPQSAEVSTNPKAAYTTPVLTTYGAVGDLTMGAVGSSTDAFGGTDPNFGPSDPRVKENIVRVGQHPLGIGLYLFDYKPGFRAQWGSDRQFGVMADEVEAVMPAAVTTHADGYKLVNYRMLGITRTIH
jgi:hypothetical protein